MSTTEVVTQRQLIKFVHNRTLTLTLTLTPTGDARQFIVQHRLDGKIIDSDAMVRRFGKLFKAQPIPKASPEVALTVIYL